MRFFSWHRVNGLELELKNDNDNREEEGEEADVEEEELKKHPNIFACNANVSFRCNQGQLEKHNQKKPNLCKQTSSMTAST